MRQLAMIFAEKQMPNNKPSLSICNSKKIKSLEAHEEIKIRNLIEHTRIMKSLVSLFSRSMSLSRLSPRFSLQKYM